MTFLEALQWMSKSEDNVCVFDNNEYKLSRDGLILRKDIEGEFVRSDHFLVNYYIDHFEDSWEKLKPKKKITFYEALIERVSGAKELIWIDTKDPHRNFAYTGNTKEIEIENE